MIHSAWRARAIYAAPLFAAMFLAAWSPTEDGATICPFALATGSACPGCGMTRAMGFLVRGDLGSALAFHPLVFLVTIQAIAGWGWLVLRRRDRVKPISSRLLSAVVVGTAVSLFAVWVLRAVAGTLPPV
jgi:hypothetical protein